jgi:hypothetical protein
MLRIVGSTLARGIALPAVMFFVLPVQGAIIQVNFTIAETSGYLGPVVGTVSGEFSFDDSTFEAGTSYSDSINGFPMLTMSLSWLNTSWDTTNSAISHLIFDENKALTSWGIAGAYLAEFCFHSRYGCVVSSELSAEPDYLITGTSAIGSFPGLVDEIDGFVYGNTSWSFRQVDAVPVSEPSAFGLLSLGLALVYLTRRQRNSVSRLLLLRRNV